MTPATVSKERKAFEKWADAFGLELRRFKNGEYWIDDTRIAWLAWKARAEKGKR